MLSYNLADAGQLIQAAYSGPSHQSLASSIQASLDTDDVQALYLTNGILLIPGSNSLADYLKFNLRLLNIGGTRFRIDDGGTEKGASGTVWHQGFLRFAKGIFDWLNEQEIRPKYVIGHSLGAAATQILVRTYGVPGIAFAAPRPRRHSGAIKHSKLCLCINRSDDPVCDLPPHFHHMDKVHRARATSFGLGHNMRHYRKAVDAQVAAGHLTARWPAS